MAESRLPADVLPDGVEHVRSLRGDGVLKIVLRVREVTHRCPPEGSGVMPCCGRTPFEVPRWHRMAVDESYVTCPVIPVQEASDG